MVKKLLTFTPVVWEMIERIKNEKGYASSSAVVYQAVINMHDKIFVPYANRSVGKNMTAEEKIRKEEEEKEARSKVDLEKKVAICQTLGGQTVKQNDGSLLCKYFTYSFSKRYLQEIPVNLLTDDLIRNQYAPSKKDVLKLQENKKVEYNVDEIIK